MSSRIGADRTNERGENASGVSEPLQDDMLTVMQRATYPWFSESTSREPLSRLIVPVRTVANPEPTARLRRWALQLERAQEFDSYLSAVARGGLISSATAASARQAWSAIRDATHNEISAPDACPNEDGALLLTWDRAEHHLELEFVPGEEPTFFYCNRRDEQRAWELRWEPDRALDPQVLTAARHFFTARTDDSTR